MYENILYPPPRKNHRSTTAFVDTLLNIVVSFAFNIIKTNFQQSKQLFLISLMLPIIETSSGCAHVDVTNFNHGMVYLNILKLLAQLFDMLSDFLFEIINYYKK